MEGSALPGSNKSLPRIVVGTHYLTNNRDFFAQLDAAVDLGLTVFDTARVYMNGEGETCLGRWMKERSLRHRVTVITKGGHPFRGLPRLSRAEIRSDIDASLSALQLDCIDVFLLHRDDRETKIAPIITTLDEAVREGKIRYFGASNWQADRVAEGEAFACKHGMQGFYLSSPHFSLAEWNCPPWPGCISIAGALWAAERAWYAERRVPILAWSSLASGFFADRFSRRNELGMLPREVRHCERVYLSSANLSRLGRAQRLAKVKNVSTAQIALAYVLNQNLDIHAVISSFLATHLAENMAAADIGLSNGEIRWLNLEQDELEL